MATTMTEQTGSYVDLDGLRTYYEAVGEGEPLVLLHGGMCTIETFGGLTPPLAESFQVYLPERRAHGRTPDVGGPITYEIMADDTIAFIDAIGTGPVHLVGWSDGANVAMIVAVRRPDLVRALILSNTAHRIGTAEMWNARIDKIAADGLVSLVDPVMERWFTPAFRKPDNAAYAGARNMLSQQPEAGYSGTCAAIRDADFTEEAGRIAVPTLCVAGDQDGSTPPELVRSLADIIPASRLVTIAGCGHIPCLEQPLAYAQAASIFLKTLPEH